ANEHAHRSVTSIVAHQACDGIERVIHKVRLHLPSQGRKLCFRQLLIESRSLGYLTGHGLARLHYVSHGQYQRIRDHEQEYLVEQPHRPCAYERWPFSIAPRVEEHLEQSGP